MANRTFTFRDVAALFGVGRLRGENLGRAREIVQHMAHPSLGDYELFLVTARCRKRLNTAYPGLAAANTVTEIRAALGADTITLEEATDDAD